MQLHHLMKHEELGLRELFTQRSETSLSVTLSLKKKPEHSDTPVYGTRVLHLTNWAIRNHKKCLITVCRWTIYKRDTQKVKTFSLVIDRQQRGPGKLEGKAVMHGKAVC